jgi:hypothetical protein
MSTDILLNTLATVLDRMEPLPADLVDRAVELFALHRLDVELLELLEDSELAAAGVRATEPSCRFMTFQGATSTIEVEIDPAASVVIGMVTPPGAHRVTVQGEHDDASVTTDELGRFEAQWPRGPWMRLTIQLADGSRLVTPSIAM